MMECVVLKAFTFPNFPTGMCWEADLITEDQIDTGTSGYQGLEKKLLTGRCDLSVDRLEILLGFKAIGKDFINHPDLAYQVIPGEPAEPFHMMFTKNAWGRNLKQIVDKGIRELKGSGELEAIMEKYSLLISSAAGSSTQ